MTRAGGMDLLHTRIEGFVVGWGNGAILSTLRLASVETDMFDVGGVDGNNTMCDVSAGAICWNGTTTLCSFREYALGSQRLLRGSAGNQQP